LNRLKIKGGTGARELGTIVACETTLIRTLEKGKRGRDLKMLREAVGQIHNVLIYFQVDGVVRLDIVADKTWAAVIGAVGGKAGGVARGGIEAWWNKRRGNWLSSVEGTKVFSAVS
jgi:hypothetical protein